LNLLTCDWQGHRNTDLPKRPAKGCTLGKEVTIGLNTYHVVQYPQKPVNQFDVSIIGTGPDANNLRRTVIMKVWNSKPVQDRIDQSWIYDGNKLAWYVPLLSS
jgi:eukaryotic translation initiation factor 2C